MTCTRKPVNVNGTSMLHAVCPDCQHSYLMHPSVEINPGLTECLACVVSKLVRIAALDSWPSDVEDRGESAKEGGSA